MIPYWFDAHLDLAYLAECGRDMHADLDDCRGTLLPAAVTLASLADGRVRACLGTIFTEGIPGDAAPDRSGTYAYPIGDAEAAHTAGLRQLKLYQAWAEAGLVELIPRRTRTTPGTGRTDHAGPASTQRTPLALGILMECADPIRSPDELGFWVDSGVVAIGLAWWHQSRYAGGNGTDAGLSDAGRALVRQMDELGVVHDASHLSDRALRDLFEATDRVVMATHSNCRALLEADNQRHLTDDAIAEIGRRGGIVGLNLVRNFIRAGLGRDERPGVDEAVAHVEHVCQIMGHRTGVGLGSDMDGGITANDLPEGIDRPAHLPRLGDALRDRGWSDADVHAFAWGNWARFWGMD